MLAQSQYQTVENWPLVKEQSVDQYVRNGLFEAVTYESKRTMQGLEVVMSQVGTSMGPDLIIGRVSDTITMSLLTEAAYRLQQMHPLLRASIRWPDGDGARPVFYIHPPNKSLLQIEEAATPPNHEVDGNRQWWQVVAEQQASVSFDLKRGYFLRIVWVPDSGGKGGHLICASHHAVVDGTSLMRIMNQLLGEVLAIESAYRKQCVLSYSEAACSLVPVQALEVTPSLFSKLEFSWKDKILAKLAKPLVLHEMRRFNRAPWFPVQTNQQLALEQTKVTTLCEFRDGAPESWESLRRLSKKNAVTVGGAFSAAVQLAVMGFLAESDSSLESVSSLGKYKVPLSMDFNMRNRIDGEPENKDSVGLYTSIGDVGVSAHKDMAFWTLADKIISNARKQVDRRLPAVFQLLVDDLTEYHEFLSDNGVDLISNSGVTDGINISNVGPYPFNREYSSDSVNFSLDALYGFNGACIGSPLFIFWLRCINGRLFYNSIGCSPAVDRACLSYIQDEVFYILEELIPNMGDEPLTISGYLNNHTRGSRN